MIKAFNAFEALEFASENIELIAQIGFISSSLLAGIFILILLLIYLAIRRKLRKASFSAEDLATKLSGAVAAISEGNTLEAQSQAKDALITGIGWYGSQNFVRWLFSAAIAVLVFYGGLVGTILIKKQNDKLDAQTASMVRQEETMELQNNLLKQQNDQQQIQNELTNLNFTQKLGDLLAANGEVSAKSLSQLPQLAAGEDGSLSAVMNDRASKVALTYQWHDYSGQKETNPALVSDLIETIKNSPIKSRYIKTLTALVSDERVSVRAASLHILANIDVPYRSREFVDLDGLVIKDLIIPRDANVSFRNSFILGHVRCVDLCAIHLVDSYANQVSGETIAQNSFIEGFNQYPVIDGVTSPRPDYGLRLDESYAGVYVPPPNNEPVTIPPFITGADFYVGVFDQFAHKADIFFAKEKGAAVYPEGTIQNREGEIEPIPINTCEALEAAIAIDRQRFQVGKGRPVEPRHGCNSIISISSPE